MLAIAALLVGCLPSDPAPAAAEAARRPPRDTSDTASPGSGALTGPQIPSSRGAVADILAEPTACWVTLAGPAGLAEVHVVGLRTGHFSPLATVPGAAVPQSLLREGSRLVLQAVSLSGASTRYTLDARTGALAGSAPAADPLLHTAGGAFVGSSGTATIRWYADRAAVLAGTGASQTPSWTTLWGNGDRAFPSSDRTGTFVELRDPQTLALRHTVSPSAFPGLLTDLQLEAGTLFLLDQGRSLVASSQIILVYDARTGDHVRTVELPSAGYAAMVCRSAP